MIIRKVDIRLTFLLVSFYFRFEKSFSPSFPLEAFVYFASQKLYIPGRTYLNAMLKCLLSFKTKTVINIEDY